MEAETTIQHVALGVALAANLLRTLGASAAREKIRDASQHDLCGCVPFREEIPKPATRQFAVLGSPRKPTQFPLVLYVYGRY